MRLLNAGGHLAGYQQIDRGNSPGLAATLAEEGDRGDANLLGRLEGEGDIFGLAAGGDGDQDIAFLRKRMDLAGEDLVEAEVVADGGEGAGGIRETNRRIRAAVIDEAGDELGGDVSAVAGAAPVAAGEELVAVEEAVGHEFGGAGERLG